MIIILKMFYSVPLTPRYAADGRRERDDGWHALCVQEEYFDSSAFHLEQLVSSSRAMSFCIRQLCCPTN